MDTDTPSGEGDSGTGTPTDTEPVSTETASLGDTGSAGDTGTPGETDTDRPTDTNGDTETATHTDTGSNSDTESDTEKNTDVDAGTGDLCQDGWLDKDHNLCWEDPPGHERLNFQAIGEHCAALGEGWVVPSISQLRKLVSSCEKSEFMGYYPEDMCRINDYSDGDSATLNCGGCSPGSGPAGGCYFDAAMEGDCFDIYSDTDSLETTFYWSSTAYKEFEGDDDHVWGIDFVTAEISTWTALSLAQYRVRCVLPL